MHPKEPLEKYLHHLHEIRATGAGVPEESYYGALETLLNTVGEALKPAVRCVPQLANRGNGEPDFGLFTKDQFQRGSVEPLAGQPPARGVGEVKAPEENLDITINSPQLLRYLSRYGLALLTNYREFRLVGLVDGRPVMLESFTLAEDAAAFWQLTAHPRAAATAQGEAFFEFLLRVMLSNAPLSTPKDVAWFLASYAREARARVESAEVPALASVRRTLEGALGLTFQGEKGEHFFRSTLVQTLFYGLFSAWVLWQQRGAHGQFDWHEAGGELHVPMIQFLFEELTRASRLRSLGLEALMERAESLLNRVDAESFFAQFRQEHAVQYFYEPFLEAFDPELRKELGVWYTPPEIVEYMVARVDAVLREELGIAEGLADPNVVVLDPCCGTGAYLVEVLRRIHATLEERGLGALSDLTLKDAALHRVFGFEILPAPFVIAHLQLGLLLHTLGDALTAANERVGVFLTNALTGWEPPSEEAKRQIEQLTMAFPEIRDEVDAAARVKGSDKILVVLGNPPYNGFAGMAVDEERSLTSAYRTSRLAPAPQGKGLNDLYIRFYRMAERQIVERTHRGVVCFISNYSWLDGLSFTGMRERFLEVFDRVWIDCMNGDKYKTGKTTPDGKPDPSIFSTDYNREGIQVGTAIGLLVRTGTTEVAHDVNFRHLWGRQKREELVESLDLRPFDAQYIKIVPPCPLGFPFMPTLIESAYLTWPQLPELFPTYYSGINSKRDELVVDIDRHLLKERMRSYFNPAVSNEEMKRICARAMENSDQFEAISSRERLIRRGFLPEYIVRHSYRPFDTRWLYWEPETHLIGRKVPEYFPNITNDNIWIITQRRPRADWRPPQLIRHIACLDLVDRGATAIPLYHRQHFLQASLFGDQSDSMVANASEQTKSYLTVMDCSIEGVFFHALAILHAPLYRTENAGALRQDWPRIPLPASKDVLLASAALGRQVALLLDPEAPVAGITAGAIRPELREVGLPSREGGGTLVPGELAVTAGWGHAGQGGVTMPARGKAVERDYTAEERAALGTAIAHLGDTTFDIYLNDRAYWRNVPARVWSYTLGGYQVLKKWLSYRESALLGRPLKPEEVRYVSEVTRRIAALLLLEPELDTVYQAAKADTFSFEHA